MIKIVLIFILFTISLPSYSASKCQEEWDYLKKVQAQLRYKSTEYWRKKEHEAHNIYQNCRKGKNKKTTSRSSQIEIYKNKKSKIKFKKYKKVGNPIATVKGFYTGEKQNAWIKYYKTPKECKNPKTTSKFAKCLEHKRETSKEFDIIWKEKNSNKITPFKLGRN